MKPQIYALAAFVAISNFVFAGNPVKDTAKTGNTENTDNSYSMLSNSHRGGSSGSGAIEGKNVVYAGVGFVGGLQLLGTVYKSEGYSVSSTPTITLGYERGLSEHWGLGLTFDYSSVTLNSTGSVDNTSGYYPYNTGQIYNYTDKATLTGIAFGVTGAYHFSASEKIDPYIGGALGYTSINFSYTTDDPNATYGDGNAPLNISASAVTFGGFLGIRFYFTDNIGAWADIGYFGYGGSLLNLGLAAKF